MNLKENIEYLTTIKLAKEYEQKGDLNTAIKLYDQAKELAEEDANEQAFKKADEKILQCLIKQKNEKTPK